jgi:hypothetical protein
MYLTVRIFLKSEPAITAKIPNFNEFMAALDAAILQIQTNSELHQYSSKGVTGNKKQLRESLIIITADASRKMQAYASYANETVLLAETKFTESYLNRATDLQLTDISKGLYVRIDENIAKLTPYGLTVDSQTAFKASIDAFVDAIPQPRQNQLEKKENTLLEDLGFEMADKAVNNIDMGVEILRLSDPTFYAGYKNARKIVEQGNGTLQVQGEITDAGTGLPIMDATLLFRINGQTEVIMEKRTAAKGGFMIKSLTENIYQVSISKTGYQTQTIVINVTPDQLCNLNAALEKL